MKALKIVGSILLVLVLVAGTYVGVITKGFRKWKNLKTEKQNVTNFINYGKNGIPSEDYKALANENEQLTKTIDDLTEDNSKLLSEKTTLTNQVDNLTEDNSKLLSEKTTLTNQVDNLTDEKNTLSEKNSELQNKIKEYEERSQYFTTDYYVVDKGNLFTFYVDVSTFSANDNLKTKTTSEALMSLYNCIKFSPDYLTFDVCNVFEVIKIGETSPLSTVKDDKISVDDSSLISKINISIRFDKTFSSDRDEFLTGVDASTDYYYICSASYEIQENNYLLDIVFTVFDK